jgi:cell wall-associated NlpC family hydrolase
MTVPQREGERLQFLSQHHRTAGAAIAVTLAVGLMIWPRVATASSGASETTGAMRAVIAAARSHVGAPYRYGGTGPGFDCSGLIYRVFKETHELARVGGRQRTAGGLLHWFEARGLVSRKAGRPGDLVIYNGGTHVGIYVGNGKVISAIVHGVRRHGLRRLTIPFTVFLHTRLAEKAPAPRDVAGLRSVMELP